MSEFVGVIGAALSVATPMIIAASGETLLERSGILNIGLEGTMLSSAYAAFFFAHTTSNPWIGAAAAVAVGLILGAISSWFVIRLAVDQVVVGTGMNLFALGVTGTLFALSFGRGGKLVSIPSVPKLEGALSLNPLMLFAIAAPIICWILLTRTRWGLAARACGEDPSIADALGYSSGRIRYQAAVIASALAGIAGGYLTLAQTSSFAPNMTVGIGFVIIAAVTFGRWTIIGSVIACLTIAIGYGVQFWLKARQSAIPYQLFDALPYIFALVVLVWSGRSGAAPAALGVPHKRT